MNKELQNKITQKLDQLSELLDAIDEAHTIDPDEPETWDSDTLYGLTENLKDALKLLADQKIKDRGDEFGQPLYEDGLCSLVDNYQAEIETDD